MDPPLHEMLVGLSGIELRQKRKMTPVLDQRCGKGVLQCVQNGTYLFVRVCLHACCVFVLEK